MINNQNDYVHARIDTKLKNAATHILNKLGLSISEFIKLSFNQVIHDQGVQFELSLMAEDTTDQYTKVKDLDHVKKLIKYKGK